VRPLTAEPSAWVVAHLDRIPRGAGCLDVAAGGGRHARLLLERGQHVTAVDVDVSRLRPSPGLEVVQADLERDPWPLAERRFGGVIVTRYLHRPLLPTLVEAVDEGGVLLYETFLAGHERVAPRPSNPDYLLRPGELRAVAEAGGLEVIAVHEGPVEGNRPAVLAQLVARRP
jgi:SAM-dependent methyltransferase